MWEVYYHDFRPKAVSENRDLMIYEIRKRAKEQAINILPSWTTFRIIRKDWTEAFKVVIKN